MKQTLLQIVKKILNEIDGDEVNSVTDTAESEQVAELVSTTYLAILSNSVWPHTRRAIAIDPRSDDQFPTHAKLREEVKELISVRYNAAKFGETRRAYKEIVFLDADNFLRRINSRNSDSEFTDIIIDDSGIELLIQNDKAPDYYTSFNDVDIVFDSYDKEVDNSIQQSKIQAQGYIIPEFKIQDDFVPDLPVDAFSLLIEESTSRVQFKLRQIQDVKSEVESQRQARYLSQKNWSVGVDSPFPNYGRVRNAGIQRIQPWSQQSGTSYKNKG